MSRHNHWADDLDIWCQDYVKPIWWELLIIVVWVVLLAWVWWPTDASAQDDPFPWATDSEVISSFYLRFTVDPMSIAALDLGVLFAPLFERHNFILLREPPLLPVTSIKCTPGTGEPVLYLWHLLMGEASVQFAATVDSFVVVPPINVTVECEYVGGTTGPMSIPSNNWVLAEESE